MKKDIVKELQRGMKARKEANSNNPVIHEVNRLLEYDTLRDNEILKSIGANCTLVQSENERGAVIEIEKREKYYDGAIFTDDQIVTLAAKYRLKFLPSVLFSSYLTPLIASDIKELERKISESMTIEQANRRNMSIEDFIAENGKINYTFDASELKNKFYILAPASNFKLEKKKAFTLKSPDPILFYKTDEIHYRLVRKWGSDFTIFRRLKGLVFHNRRSLYWTLFSLAAFITATTTILFGLGCLALMILAGIAIPVVYATDWDSNFFGKPFVKGKYSYVY